MLVHEAGVGGDWLGGVADGTAMTRVPDWRDLEAAVEEEAGGGRRATGVTGVVVAAACAGGAVASPDGLPRGGGDGGDGFGEAECGETGSAGVVAVCLERVRRPTGVTEAGGAGDRAAVGESEKLETGSCEHGERGAAAAVLRVRALRVLREWVGDEPLPTVEEERRSLGSMSRNISPSLLWRFGGMAMGCWCVCCWCRPWAPTDTPLPPL